jgi:two-component system sensor histidine kinase SenX3
MNVRWTTLLPILLLTGLLGVLGVLQYRWMRQISASEGEKAHQYVHEQTQRFAGDFNREIQNAYFNFQTGSDVFKEKNWAPFNERYDYWKTKATYPGLITDFYFFRTEGGNEVLRYNVETRAFEPAAGSSELDPLRARMADDKNFRPVDASASTLILPIHDVGQKIERLEMRELDDHVHPPGMPARYGFLAIKLDEGIVREKLLTDLKTRYFGDGEYNVAVTETGGKVVFQGLKSGDADASAGLFDLSPDNMIFYANRDLVRSIGGDKSPDIVIDQKVEMPVQRRIETVTGTTDAGTNSVVKLEVKRDAKPRTSIFTTRSSGGIPDTPWTLSVQHASGSLDGYIASTLRRNLAVGFGILLLLAAAVGAVIVSAIRAKRLAQRQLDFVSSVSHEFRTPLAVIYSAGENLADGVAKEDSQVSKYGDLIKGEGRKLTAMVEQILDFAGARSGKRKFSFAETNVEKVIDGAIAECEPAIKEHGFTIERSVAEGIPHLKGDAAALEQAVQNLIANSIKYSNGQKWLKVTASNGDGHVRIRVEDRGVGISKADLKQIFEPFYRAKNVVDAQIHGNGLGLSLVKQIVTAHGGTVLAESEIGKGSSFTIELPQS